jgi:uncharacterized repeat protein (TIGR03803 family)
MRDSPTQRSSPDQNPQGDEMRIPQLVSSSFQNVNRRFFRSRQPARDQHKSIASIARRRMSAAAVINCALFLLCAALVLPSQAQTYTTLLNFDSTNGSHPSSPLVQGLDGQLYGAASSGGNNGNCSGIGGCGTLFKITTDGALTTLYDFCPVSQCLLGRSPGSTIVQDVTGNFFGTTPFGGQQEWGEVFRFSPSGSTFVRLYSFCAQTNCSDGMNPGGLVLAPAGSVYGVTDTGGTHGQGTVFKITTRGALTTLYNFCAQANCADGQEPGSLVAASNGTLYGLTFAGGASNSRGTIFKITPSGAFSTLYTFCSEGGTTCTSGAYPGGLFQAADGNLYGTASGGANDAGMVFKISPAGAFQTVYSFCSQPDCADGSGPGSLIQGSDGSLYGTTGSGGGPSNEGTFFKLTPGGVLTVLYGFCPVLCQNNPAPGALAQATDGNFYGLTFYGLDNSCGGPGCGTVFKLSAGLAPFVKTIQSQGKAGSTIVILGTNLTGATHVTFNGTSAAYTVVSGTEITATVPAGATSGKIKVVTPTGTLTSNIPFQVLP